MGYQLALSRRPHVARHDEGVVFTSEPLFAAGLQLIDTDGVQITGANNANLDFFPNGGQRVTYRVYSAAVPVLVVDGDVSGLFGVRVKDSSNTTRFEIDEGTITHSGTAVGFNGATPVGKRTLGAAATDAATTQTLANNLRQALIDLGLGQT